MGGRQRGGLCPAPPALPGCSAEQRGGGAALLGAQVEISPSVAGTAAEERPVRAARSRLAVSRRSLPAVMSNYIHVPPGSPEVPKLDITVSEREGPGYRQGALQLLRRLRPHWRPEEVTLQVRPGPGSALRGGCGSASAGREGKSGQGRGRAGGHCAGELPPCFLALPPSPALAAAPCAEPHLLGGPAAGRGGAAASPAPRCFLPTARFPPPPPPTASPRQRRGELESRGRGKEGEVFLSVTLAVSLWLGRAFKAAAEQRTGRAGGGHSAGLGRSCGRWSPCRVSAVIETIIHVCLVFLAGLGWAGRVGTAPVTPLLAAPASSIAARSGVS